MKMPLKKAFVLFLLMLVLTVASYSLDVVYLYLDDCPSCKKAEQFMSQYDQLSITRVDVSEEPVRARSYTMQWDINNVVVPTIHIDGETFVGFNDQIEQRMKRLIELDIVLGEDYENGTPVSLFDSINSPLLITAGIGILDGFNPCSIWAMLFIVTIIFRYRDTRKLVLVGSLYLITLSALYAIFILGIYSVVNYLSYIPFFKWVYFALILGIAVLGLVDPDRLTIPDKWADFFKKKSKKNLLSENRSWLSLSLLSISLAFFATLIELPCTAGLPLIWSAYASSLGESFNYHLGLMVYIAGYIMVEATILIVAIVTAKKIALTKKAGLLLKRITSVVMLLLGVYMLFRY